MENLNEQNKQTEFNNTESNNLEIKDEHAHNLAEKLAISPEQKRALIDAIMKENEPKYEMPRFQDSYHYEKMKKRAARKKKNFARLFTCCVCILLVVCVGCGYLGSYIYNKFNPVTQTENNIVNQYYSSADNKSNNIVIKTISENSTINISGDLSSVAENVAKTVVLVKTELANGTSQGSGVMFGVSENAQTGEAEYVYIVTNLHVVDNFNKSSSNPITITTLSKNTYKAYFVGADAANDIAVIKVKTADMVATDVNTAVVGNSDNLKPLNDVIAVGNALGEGFSFTKGVVSSYGTKTIVMDLCVFNLIQTDTTINSGNSGGGLFDASGALVGIVNAKSVGTSVEGTGYAIPINTAIEVAQNICYNISSSGKGYNPGSIFLGLSVSNVNGGLYLSSNSVADTNYYSTSTNSNYTFTAGSYITQIAYVNSEDNSKSWTLSESGLTMTALASKLAELKLGDTLTFTVKTLTKVNFYGNYYETETVTCLLNQYIYPN